MRTLERHLRSVSSFGTTPLGRRLVRGVGANAYGQGVTIALQLITVPVLIHTWGLEHFGLWLTLTAIPAYLSLTDLGFSQVAASTLTMKVAANDRHGAMETFASAFVLLSGLTAVAALVSTALIAFAPLQDWLARDVGVSVRVVLMLITAQVLTAVMTGLASAGLRAEGHYALMTAINATTRLGTGLAVLAVAMLGGDLVAAAAAMLIGQLVCLVVAAGWLRRIAPWLKLDLGKVRSAELRLSLAPSLSFGAYTFGNMLSLQGLVIVLASTLGPVAVASVSVARTLCRLGVTAGSMVSYAVQPEYSALFGRGDTAGLRKLMRRHLETTASLALVYFAGMASLGSWVLHLWTRDAVEVPRGLLLMLTAGCGLEILWLTFLTPLVATNRHKTLGVLYLLISGGALILVALLAPALGVVVAGWHALTVSALMLLICVIHALHFRAGLDPAEAGCAVQYGGDR